MNAARPEAFLRDREAVTLGPQQVGLGHAAPVVHHFAVAEDSRPGVTHHVDVAHQFEPGCVGGNEDHAGPLVRGRLWVRHRHHDREVGTVGTCGEPLLTGDHVVVAVLHGHRVHQHRVAARLLGLGHREAAAHLAFDERSQEALALLGIGEQVQDLHVAGVGRLRVEHIVPQRGASECLAEQTVLEHRQPLTAPLDRMVRRPQAHLAHTPLRVRDTFGERHLVVVEHRPFERDDLLVDEVIHHVEDDRHLLRNLEVHLKYLQALSVAPSCHPKVQVS